MNRAFSRSLLPVAALGLLVASSLAGGGCSSEFCGYVQCVEGAGGSGGSGSGSSTSSTTTTTSSSDASSGSGVCVGGCPPGENSTGACVDGQCQYTCATDFGDCDADPTTCETNVTTDTDCGTCDVQCATECASIDGTHQCNDPVDVAAGLSHTCAVRKDGSVWCWGLNNFGQIGIGSAVQSQFIPAHVTLAFKATHVSAQHNSTCAISASGDLACWGRDGNNNSTPLPYPTFGDVAQVAVGGSNPLGGVGASLVLDGASGAARIFVVSNTVEPSTSTFLNGQASIAAGGGHHCSINAANEVRCAGANNKQQLGAGSSNMTEPTPLKIPAFNATSVALGARHSCAIKTTNELACWGDNNQFQSGGPSTGSTVTTPTVVLLPGAAPAQTIGCGEETTGALSGGTLYLLGRNDFNQVSQTMGATIAIPTAYPLANVVKFALGSRHSCAIQSSGVLVCWGSNAADQLGTGLTGTPSPTPVEPAWP